MNALEETSAAFQIFGLKSMMQAQAGMVLGIINGSQLQNGQNETAVRTAALQSVGIGQSVDITV